MVKQELFFSLALGSLGLPRNGVHLQLGRFLNLLLVCRKLGT